MTHPNAPRLEAGLRRKMSTENSQGKLYVDGIADEHVFASEELELAKVKEELKETFAILGQTKKNRKIFEEIIKIQ